MQNHSLVVVGCGIKILSHMTVEARVHIEQADKVLYLVNEPTMKKWIEKANDNAESLDPLYCKFPVRTKCYRAISDYILEVLAKTQNLCVVMYGHPTVFAKPALDAAREAKQLGFDSKIFPGISAEDCLFADLVFDPSNYGSLSYEATDFLVHHRPVDPACNLILWQVGILGAMGRADTHDNRVGAKILTEYLLKHYPKDHKVNLYQAAQYPHFDHQNQEINLSELPNADYSALTTLYIPPAIKKKYDPEMIAALGMDLQVLLES